MEVRELKIAELDEVLDLHLVGLEHELDLMNSIIPCKSIDPDGRPHLKKILSHMLHTDECNIFVAKENNSLVAYCLATKKMYPAEKPKLCGTINGIYIKPEARRQKLGTKLFDLAVNWFKEGGVAYVELYHMINDPKAENFWKSLGFTPIQQNCMKILN